MSYLRSPVFLLILILLSFLFREIFLAGVFPLFTGQDEARHYNSIQWLFQKKDLDCLHAPNTEHVQDKKNLATYRYSEEIRQTSATADLGVLREENYRKPIYSATNQGLNEALIKNSNWSKNTSFCPPDIASRATSFSLFHVTEKIIEKTLHETSIFTRFYLERILSVLFGTLTILFGYFGAKEAGLSRRSSLLIALIISLQPRLSIYTTNINYDTLLIPCFALFIWGGLAYLNQRKIPFALCLLTLALGGAILTKGTSLMLMGGIIFLGVWTFLKKNFFWRKMPLYYWFLGGVLLILLGLVANHAYPAGTLFPNFSFSSLSEYLGKSLPRIPSSSKNFWGTLSWNEAALGPWFVYTIWCIEILALVGLIRFFFSKETPNFLPTKTAALFCIAIFLSLQIGVRVFDWRTFQETGSLVLGTPGRYFLPTLLAQLLLVTVGLGALLKKQIHLERALLAFALIMLAFNLYTVWLIIIPRFYL